MALITVSLFDLLIEKANLIVKNLLLILWLKSKWLVLPTTKRTFFYTI